MNLTPSNKIFIFNAEWQLILPQDTTHCKVTKALQNMYKTKQNKELLQY